MSTEPPTSAMSGLRPVSWPPTDLPVPTLWDRARMLFQDVLNFIGSALTLATTRLTRRQHTQLINLIQPVEFLLRALFYAEALTLVLTTEEGRAIRAKATPLPRFLPRPLRNAAAATRTAPIAPTTDPEIALEAPHFTVFHWPRADRHDADTPRPRAQADRMHLALSQLRHRTLHADDALMPERASLALGRRVLAIRHALENRESLIRKLARHIARIPVDDMPPGFARHTEAARWWHGRPEYYNACAYARAITRDLFRRLAARRRLEPG
jgi:hypothetical protein